MPMPCQGSRPSTPRHRPPAPHRPPPHPTTTTAGRERARAREGQGRGKDSPARGRREAQGSRQAPTWTGHLVRHNTGARNHQLARKGTDQGPGTEGEGATTDTRPRSQEGHATTERTAPPHPQPTPGDARRRTPAKTRRRSTDQTPHERHRLTPTDHRTPHRGKSAHPLGEKRLPPSAELPRTPPHSLQPRPRCQATTPAAARATTPATTQAPEEEEDTAATPRTRGKDAQRTRDQATGL